MLGDQAPHPPRLLESHESCTVDFFRFCSLPLTCLERNSTPLKHTTAIEFSMMVLLLTQQINKEHCSLKKEHLIVL